MRPALGALLAVVVLLSPASAGARPLAPGDHGRAVRAIQQRLGLVADGVYGRRTARAVRRFQRRHALAATGVADGATRRALRGQPPEAPPDAVGGAPYSDAPPSIVEEARSALGRPYRAGANGPKAFDCSGLVVWAARATGVELPQSSFELYKAGRPLRRSGLAAGDLVFFDTNGPGPSDVGIATGPTTAISATTHGVREHDVLGPYWGEHYLGARRLTTVG